MTVRPGPAQFEISPAVVFRLGEELISDSMQALVELVKNAYDADATWVKVTIRTSNDDAAGESGFAGEIVVEDNGLGMDGDSLRTGWLMIAGSEKKELKRSRHETPRGRTPLGDKGLGRLGIQRLGREVEIVTRAAHAGAHEWRLEFSWRDFESATTLSSVPVRLGSDGQTSGDPGTRITVRDLVNADQWLGQQNHQRLTRSLSELISPYGEVRDFMVYVTVNGTEVALAHVADQIRKKASVKYVLQFDGITLKMAGSVRLDFLLRAGVQKVFATEWKDCVRSDEGRELFDYLISVPGSKARLSRPEYIGTDLEYLRFAEDVALATLSPVALVGTDVANPGSFHAEIDYILLDSYDEQSGIWDSKSEFKRFIKDLAGIRVYRDGFGVRVGEDWLGLGKQATSGGSLYGLRLNNTLGYVAISARENAALLETTNREGFQKTAHFDNFFALLQRFVAWSGFSMDLLRRRALEHLEAFGQRRRGMDPANPVASGGTVLERNAAAIDEKSRTIGDLGRELRDVVTKAQNVAKNAVELAPQATLFEDERAAEREALNELLAVLEDPRVGAIDSQPSLAESTKAIVRTLEERDERLRRDLEVFHEAMALGLAAEALSHEIAAIADRLAERAAGIASHLAKDGHRDTKVLAFVEHVRSSVDALRKQLGHLHPRLRYIRENRENICVGAFLSEQKAFYAERFLRHGIDVVVRVESDFVVTMNRGKLSQIVDNLLLNSEFWLREARRRDPGRRGQLVFNVVKPCVLVSDDGPGVPLSVEETLFQPFVTTKAPGVGRGLGLYVVQQLLEVEGCEARLRPERNASGHRFKFEVNLAGALHGR